MTSDKTPRRLLTLEMCLDKVRSDVHARADDIKALQPDARGSLLDARDSIVKGIARSHVPEDPVELLQVLGSSYFEPVDFDGTRLLPPEGEEVSTQELWKAVQGIIYHYLYWEAIDCCEKLVTQPDMQATALG